MKRGSEHLAMTALLAGLALGPPGMGTVAVPLRDRPTRDEEERQKRKRADDLDAMNAAKEKRERKNAKRLQNTMPNIK